MSLGEMQWSAMSMHPMVLAWLRGERHGYVAQILPRSGVSPHSLAMLLDNPDLTNADENRERLRLLYFARNIYFLEFPQDTVWYEVRNLRHEHIGELLAVNHQAWTDPRDQSELLKVAARKRIPMDKPLSQWERPILWAHTKAGPFTIVEGNNRLASYAWSGRTDLDMPVFVGLSALRCMYHLPDRIGPLIRDMLGG